MRRQTLSARDLRDASNCIVAKPLQKLIKDVLDVKRESFRNEKHKAQWFMTLNNDAKPLHKKPIADITRDDILEALKPIWTRIPDTADRTRQRIAAVIDHAKARGLCVGDNPADWRGGLKELLPVQKKIALGHAAVAYKDLPAVITKLRESGSVAACAVEFIALTAARFFHK